MLNSRGITTFATLFEFLGCKNLGSRRGALNCVTLSRDSWIIQNCELRPRFTDHPELRNLCNRFVRPCFSAIQAASSLYVRTVPGRICSCQGCLDHVCGPLFGRISLPRFCSLIGPWVWFKSLPCGRRNKYDLIFGSSTLIQMCKRSCQPHSVYE